MISLAPLNFLSYLHKNSSSSSFGFFHFWIWKEINFFSLFLIYFLFHNHWIFWKWKSWLIKIFLLLPSFLCFLASRTRHIYLQFIIISLSFFSCSFSQITFPKKARVSGVKDKKWKFPFLCFTLFHPVTNQKGNF